MKTDSLKYNHVYYSSKFHKYTWLEFVSCQNPLSEIVIFIDEGFLTISIGWICIYNEIW